MEKLTGFGQPNQEAIENREQRAEVLLRFLNTAKNIKPFNDKKFEEIFSDEKHKRDFIKNLSTEEFLELLNGINGILREKNKEDWDFDGQHETAGGIPGFPDYITVALEDKPELLREVLESAKFMNSNNRTMKDISLLIAASINVIHPFKDGNGRTSRFLYQIFSEDYSTELRDELKKNLSGSSSHLENNTSHNINPSYIMDYVNDLVNQKIGIENNGVEQDRIGWNADLDMVSRKKITEACKTSIEMELFSQAFKEKSGVTPLTSAVIKFLSNNPNIDREKIIKKFPRFTRVEMDLLVDELSSDQIRELLQIYRSIKIEYVELFIDCLVNPDKAEYEIDVDGQKIQIKDYFENRIRDENEKAVEKGRLKKEETVAEQQKKEQKENTIKSRFDNGEGDYKFFEPSEIKSIQEMERELAGMAQIEQQEISEEQKIDTLKKSLFALAGKINSNVSISQEQINSYVENKKIELVKFFAQFQKISEIMNFIENSGNFEYKINTSSNNEIPYFEQEYLDQQEENIALFLDELFSQSIYYVSPSGSALRLKLFEIKSKELSGVIQPTTEQIFYNDKMVDYTDKKVIQVSDVVPEQGKFVFEITTPEFRQKVLMEGNLEQSTKSGVGTISDEKGIYVNILEGVTLHSGWSVVGVKKLKE